MQDQLTNDQRIWLRSQLRRGDIKKIAKANGVHPYSVNRFFEGTNNHAEILESIMKLLKKRKDIYKKFDSFSDEFGMDK